MKNIRSVNTLAMTIGGLMLTASLALAQTAPPAPPATPMAARVTIAPEAPQPTAQPSPAAAPTAPAAKSWFAPMQVSLDDMRLDLDLQNLSRLDMQDAYEKAAVAYDKALTKYDDKWFDAEEKAMQKAQESLDRMSLADGRLLGEAFQLKTPRPAAPPMPQMAQMPQGRVIMAGKGSDEGIYQRGLAAIDDHHYEEAVDLFSQVVSHAGARTEGGLYWKAYTLNKLGRSTDALAAIDQLRKSYANSSWLTDAKALEVEVKQNSGKAVSPEAETDEQIKILALNGLMQSDPERALPQVENLLKTSHSPKLKQQAIIVLGLNSSPRARQDLEQIARTGNPDIQLYAIRYLARGKDTNYGQLFSEVYAGSTDNRLKSAIINSYTASKDKDRLVQIAKTEKDANLRESAIRALGEIDGQPEIWQIYQAEQTPEGKAMLLGYMHLNGNLDKLVEVAKTDKDPKVRQAAVRALANQRSQNATQALVSTYTADQDPAVKQTIVNNLANNRNGKALVEIARNEKDVKVKLRIVEQLSGMAKYSKEAQDYLQEILNK
jgi:HEAT repeat protein